MNSIIDTDNAQVTDDVFDASSRASQASYENNHLYEHNVTTVVSHKNSYNQNTVSQAQNTAINEADTITTTEISAYITFGEDHVVNKPATKDDYTSLINNILPSSQVVMGMLTRCVTILNVFSGAKIKKLFPMLRSRRRMNLKTFQLPNSAHWYKQSRYWCPFSTFKPQNSVEKLCGNFIVYNL